MTMLSFRWGCGLLAALIALPALPAAAQQDTETHRDKAGNYLIEYGDAWRKSKPEPALAEMFQFCVIRRGNRILVGAGESSEGLEGVMDFDAYIANSADGKLVSKKQVQIAGVQAREVIVEMKENGIKVNALWTVLVHQGMAYRILGIHVIGKRADFEDEYHKIVGTFKFLGDRPQWLAKNVGKPAKSAMLAGLVTWEINRPRWMETTFTQRMGYELLDQVVYRLGSGGAWIQLEAKETVGTPAAELEELGRGLASNFKNAKTRPDRVTGAAGEMAALEITGEFNNQPRVMRAAVLVEEGVTLRVWLESLKSQEDLVQKDWEQLMAGLRLEKASKAAEPRAYAWRRGRAEQAPDPVVTAILAKSAAVLPEAEMRGGQTWARPDGSQLLVGGPGPQLLTREGLRRDHVPPPAAPAGEPAWSADGRRIAFQSGDEIVVAELASGKTVKVAVNGQPFAFGPGADELLVSVAVGRPELAGYRRRTAGSRLTVVNIADGAKRPWLQFPLSRFGAAAVSPDGSRVAVVCNRDLPRSAAFGGSLYVCKSDGTDLRRLTEGPEDVSSVSWSADGKSIICVRRLSRGLNGVVGFGGDSDAYRVPVDGGAAVNLTRCGRIAHAVPAAGGLLLEIRDYLVAEPQRGWFYVRSADLEAAAAALPVPQVAPPAAGTKIAARLAGVLDGKPVRDFVPTAELMPKVAEAFAAAVHAETGVKLDFSADSPLRLPHLAGEWEIGEAPDPALLLGMGAYYGETLRRTAGAEWRVSPLRFGDWLPGTPAADNFKAEVVLPFSDVQKMLGNEDAGLRGRAWVNRSPGRKTLLVYPPAAGKQALRDASGADYLKARDLLDAGDVKGALPLLERELAASPRNSELAVDTIALCEAAGLDEVASEMVRRAVDAGTEVPELLIRRADALAMDPAKALPIYRRAVQTEWPSSDALVKLGKCYQAVGNRPVAEACWRKAMRACRPEQRSEILKLMQITPSDAENAGPPE